MNLLQLRRALSRTLPKFSAGVAFLADGALLFVKRRDGKWTLPGWREDYPALVAGEVLARAALDLGGWPPGRASRQTHPRLTRRATIYVVELPPGSRGWKPRLTPALSGHAWTSRGTWVERDTAPEVARLLRSPTLWQAPAPGPLQEPGLVAPFQQVWHDTRQNPMPQTPYVVPDNPVGHW